MPPFPLDNDPFEVELLVVDPLPFEVPDFDFVPLLVLDLEPFDVMLFFFVDMSGLIGVRDGELDGLKVGAALMVGMGETLGLMDG